jgi:hypothetical protein
MGEQSHRLTGERYINVQLWHSVVSRYFDTWKYAYETALSHKRTTPNAE